MKTKKILLLSIIFVLLAAPITVYGAEFINICTDSNYLYPFSYEENGEAKGIHIKSGKLHELYEKYEDLAY